MAQFYTSAHVRLLGACTYVNDAMALNKIKKLNIQLSCFLHVAIVRAIARVIQQTNGEKVA